MELNGKVALVTGAGSGIGKASALKLASEGADVIVVSRSKDEVEATAEAVRGFGRKALGVTADVSDDDAMKALFKSIEREFGQLDIVIANAGINGVWAPIDDLTPAEWSQTMTINLNGTFLTLHYAVPMMRKAGGAIVITSSINGNRTFTMAGASAYSTTKAGQVALGKMLAMELAIDKIRVNVICPGSIATNISENTTRRNVKIAKNPALRPGAQVPLTGGKPGSSADVAELVLFLVSERSRHITGTEIYIDGAQSLLI
jgi:NAD(P)-dependent dehydrogenase (short-subunit alcohol dehydrogenase family)